jgi:hypothetical protein
MLPAPSLEVDRHGSPASVMTSSIQTEPWLQRYSRPQLEVHAKKRANSQLYQENAFIQATDREGKFHVTDSE